MPPSIILMSGYVSTGGKEVQVIKEGNQMGGLAGLSLGLGDTGGEVCDRDRAHPTFHHQQGLTCQKGRTPPHTIPRLPSHSPGWESTAG